MVAQSGQMRQLNTKIKNNEIVFQTDPLQAFNDIDELLEEAQRLKDAGAELQILSKRYEYDHLLKIDFEQMLISANKLKERARYHKDLLYEAKSYKYLAQAYLFNDLYDKALEELQIGMGILEKCNPDDEVVIMEKANFHTAFGNIYALKKEDFSSVQSILNSVKEHEKLLDPERKRGTKFMDYANLGATYLKVNLDSAKHYANKSISLSLESEYNHNLMFINYIVIGNVYLEQKKYDQALQFYKKAETIKENKYFLNLKELYENFVKVYEAQGNETLKKEYEIKLKDLSLTISQNQNKSLRKIILDNKAQIQNRQDESNAWWWALGLLLILAAALLAYFKLKKKKKIIANLTPDSFNELIRLLKENDQTFLLAFENQFPDFTQNLLKMNADLSNSEIELLAIIKLGLSNKEIAQYKFIQHKTVQNKRHIIRKKLNLPSDTDLNKWIEDI